MENNVQVRAGAVKFPGKSQKVCKSTPEMSPPPTHSNTPNTRGFALTTYPSDSSSPVFSIICSQDFKEDVGVGAIVIELQETGEAAHSILQTHDKRCFFVLLGNIVMVLQSSLLLFLFEL